MMRIKKIIIAVLVIALLIVITACGSNNSTQEQKPALQEAQVDVFVSAATKQMDALKDKSLIIEDTRKNFFGQK